MVTKAARADVFVFDGEGGILLEVAPDASTWPRICAAWDEFMRFVAKSEAPPLTERDARVRDDPEWLEAASAYLELRSSCDALGAKVDQPKQRLIGLASHTKEEGGGVAITRFWKRGNIEYKRIPALTGIDLDAYRGPDREEIRVLIDR